MTHDYTDYMTHDYTDYINTDCTADREQSIPFRHDVEMS